MSAKKPYGGAGGGVREIRTLQLIFQLINYKKEGGGLLKANIYQERYIFFSSKQAKTIETKLYILKRPVYIFAFGEFNSQQVNVGGIQHFLAQF